MRRESAARLPQFETQPQTAGDASQRKPGMQAAIALQAHAPLAHVAAPGHVVLASHDGAFETQPQTEGEESQR